MIESEREELLTGGNVSQVFRSGNTVLREVKRDSQKVHGLLKHLELKGYQYSPRFLGMDDKGRERLSYIDGEAGNYPLKKYMWSDNALKEMAKMLRLYHDSVVDFPLTDDWQSIDNTPKPFEVICHNDFAVYNIIFKNKKPVGIIDFDVAGPGPRIWDIAYTLYTCIPLSRMYISESGEEVPYQSSVDCESLKRRVHLFFESYGKEIDDEYLDLVVLRLEGLCKTIQRKADEGDLAFQQMIEEGHIKHYQDDIEFILKHKNSWK